MRTALVTGATRGLGLATAKQLAAQGILVLVGAREREAGQRAVAEIAEAGGQASVCTLDVTDAESIRTAAHQIERDFAGLDILVNNAGILPEVAAGPQESVDLDLFRSTYDVNLFGAVAVLEAFLPLLRRSPAGRIVNVTSTMGSLVDQSDPESGYYSMVLPAYQSSKAALNSVTIAVAKQLAQTPVKVTSVCPGFVQTDLTPISRSQAPLQADDAAVVITTAATLPQDAPSGTFIDAAGVVPW